ncbi:ABC transporter ATP-binding protein [Candidatus Saccharibacteria bacterium TM7i]|nr:ABC transporter ATP-binding protein [Candidatus Saccharibacteria bacterium TM7i]
MATQKPSPKTNRQTLRLYWNEIKKYKPSFFTSLLAIPLAALFLDTFLPYLLSVTIGQLAEGTYTNISHLLWLSAGAGVIGVGFNMLGFQALIHHESNVAQSLRNTTLHTLLQKDSDFFANQKIGGLTGKFIDFINTHVGLQDLIIIQTLRFILSFGIGIGIIFLHAPILGFIILGLLILLAIQIKISLKLRAPLRHARKEMVATLNGSVADIITNNQAVKTFAQEKHEEATVSKLGAKYKKIYHKDFRWMSIEGSARLFLSVLTQIIAIAVLAWLLSEKRVDVGIAVFTVAYLQRVASQLFSLGEMLNGYDKYFLQAAPMTEILTQTPTIKDAPKAKKLTVSSGTIAFNDMTYHYPDTEAAALDSLDLTISGGQKVGLVGKSGAGKTTLTRLLLRFDDTSAGAISIDAQDIHKVTQESLRHEIAYVPQEPLLFHRSLRENIGYGKIGATNEEIIAAAKKAHALEFIEKLPEGLDTIVGERGVKLSGGQRQRIAIARAILKNAPILILDEATSALDSESEILIQKALDELMKGRTSIVIAHRLSTIAKLDRIVVMDNGKIIEDGSHSELLKNKSGIYTKLWSHQSGGFIEE